MLRRRFLFLGLFGLIASATVVVLGLVLDRSAARILFSEGHLVENATVVAYGLTLVLLLAWLRTSRRFRLHSAFIVVVLTMRELDLHKAFTSEGIMKISYYLKGEDPILVRIAAGLVLLVIVLALVRYLIYLQPLWAALRAGRPHGYAALTATLLLPLTKALDSGPRMIHKHLDLDLADGVRYWLSLAEESLELAIPLVIMLAIAQYNVAKISTR